MVFNTEIEIDYNGERSRDTITWYLEIEFRSWGIKEFFPVCPDQKVTVGDELIEATNIRAEFSDERIESIVPTELCYENKEWILWF